MIQFFTNISYYKIVIFEGYLIYYIDTGVLYTTRNFTSGVFSSIFHILTSEDIDDAISRIFTAVCVWVVDYLYKKNRQSGTACGLLLFLLRIM